MVPFDHKRFWVSQCVIIEDENQPPELLCEWKTVPDKANVIFFLISLTQYIGCVARGDGPRGDTDTVTGIGELPLLIGREMNNKHQSSGVAYRI